MIAITCAPSPHWLHIVVVVVVVVISWFPPARRTVLNSVKKSRHCTRTSFSLFVTFLFSLSVSGGAVCYNRCLYSPPCYGAGGWVLGAVSSEAWTPTDCRTAAAAAGEGALGHSSRQLDTDGAPKRATSPATSTPPSQKKSLPKIVGSFGVLNL